MKKSFLIFGLVFVLTFLADRQKAVLASPPPPAPKCNVNGVIRGVEFEKAYEAPCLKTNNCPTDFSPTLPERYRLSVYITGTSYIEGETSFNTCESIYPLNSTKEIIINNDVVKSPKDLQVNKGIGGVVTSFFYNRFDSYYMANDVTTPPIDVSHETVLDKIKAVLAGWKNSIINWLFGVRTSEPFVK